jgi:hypothetical protein
MHTWAHLFAFRALILQESQRNVCADETKLPPRLPLPSFPLCPPSPPTVRNLCRRCFQRRGGGIAGGGQVMGKGVSVLGGERAAGGEARLLIRPVRAVSCSRVARVRAWAEIHHVPCCKHVRGRIVRGDRQRTQPSPRRSVRVRFPHGPRVVPVAAECVGKWARDWVRLRPALSRVVVWATPLHQPVLPGLPRRLRGPRLRQRPGVCRVARLIRARWPLHATLHDRILAVRIDQNCSKTIDLTSCKVRFRP